MVDHSDSHTSDDQVASGRNTSEPDLENNDHGHPPHQQPVGFTTRLASIVENFSFLWFTLSMNTGILSIIMHQLPYQFNGLGVLSTIMFVFNIVLFTIFFIILLARMILFPRAIVDSCFGNFNEMVMTGTVPIAWFTITAQVGLTASTATWGGHSLFLLAMAMWWIGTFVMVITAAGVLVAVAKTDSINVDSLTPAMVIPFVGTATDALVGALIVGYSDGVSSRLAVPIILVSYILAGVGFFAGMLVFAAYFVKLLDTGLPPPAQSPTLFLLVGPPSQSSAALQLLGHAAMIHFGSYDRGVFLQTTPGMIMAAVGTLLGFLFVGLGILFLMFALYVVVEVAVKRQHSYSLVWWSTIFPVATINTAWIAFATELDSPTFRVLATIFLIVLLIDYFINWAFTIRDIYLGKLLNGKRSDKPARERTKHQ